MSISKDEIKEMKKTTISKSPVFEYLVKEIQKDINEELSVWNKSELIELILNNKFNEKNTLDDYLSLKLSSNKLKSNGKVFITYREDIFKRVNILKKSGVKEIVLFIYEDVSDETRALVDFFSNKVEIKIVQINNVLRINNKEKDLYHIGADIYNHRLVKTNSKKNVFMINVSDDIIINTSIYTMNRYARIYYIMGVINGNSVISSNKEAIILNEVLNKGTTYYHVRFDDSKGFFYREFTDKQKTVSLKEEEKIIVRKRINEYKKKIRNKKKFKRSLIN